MESTKRFWFRMGRNWFLFSVTGALLFWSVLLMDGWSSFWGMLFHPLEMLLYIFLVLGVLSLLPNIITGVVILINDPPRSNAKRRLMSALVFFTLFYITLLLAMEGGNFIEYLSVTLLPAIAALHIYTDKRLFKLGDRSFD